MPFAIATKTLFASADGVLHALGGAGLADAEDVGVADGPAVAGVGPLRFT